MPATTFSNMQLSNSRAHDCGKAHPVKALDTGVSGSEVRSLFLSVHDKIPSIINSSDK